MTETITICTCDRCGYRISPEHRHAETVDLSVLAPPGSEGGQYDDLCPKCRRSISNLLDRVFLRTQTKEEQS